MAKHSRHGRDPHDPEAWAAQNPEKPVQSIPPGSQGEQAPPPYGGPPYREGTEPPKKKRHKVFFWIFLVVQLIFLAWIIAGASGASGTPDECRGLTGQQLEICKDAYDVGTGIGVGLIIGLWLAVDFILALTYLIYRLARR
jgi:hypothetical protein